MSLPTASAVTTTESAAALVALPLETILNAVKVAEYADLLRILKVVSAEIEKKGLKATKNKKEPRKGSQPKGVLPVQLHKPRAWTEYVLARAQKEGWTAFTIGDQAFAGSKAAADSKKGAERYVFSDTDAVFNMRHAMSLGKLYWSTATKTGTHPEWYQAFEKSYVAPVAVTAVTAVTAPAAEAVPAAVAAAAPVAAPAAAASKKKPTAAK